MRRHVVAWPWWLWLIMMGVLLVPIAEFIISWWWLMLLLVFGCMFLWGVVTLRRTGPS